MTKPHARYAAPLLLIGTLAALSMQIDARQLSLPILSFAPGDVFVALETGPVMWRTRDGLITRVLPQIVPGAGEAMTFDAGGNLYVTRWSIDSTGITADYGSVEKYSNMGLPLGEVGPLMNCGPHPIVFASPGTFYVGLAGCNKTIVKTPLDSTITAEYQAAEDFYGVFWMDLGPDDCTMYYTSQGPNVKRYDVCGARQLSNFNAAPLPGGIAHDLRVLPDGRVLVSSGEVIVLLSSAGAVMRTYQVPGEAAPWTGLDLVGDGTFWVGNYISSNVYRFNLADGRQIGSFNTATPAHTVVGVRVMR
jgi:outer membrane protein assembly factor BamB